MRGKNNFPLGDGSQKELPFAPWRHAAERLCFSAFTVSIAASSPPTPAPAPARTLSLGVIFLTLYIDLIGFSIIFPLGPDLLGHYLKLEGHSGALGWILAQTDALAHAFGKDSHFAAVLFGGIISSVFSILQFVFAPFWGSLSDRLGRRLVGVVAAAVIAGGVLLAFGASAAVPALALAGILAHGVGSGATIAVRSATFSDVFGGPNFGTIFGLLAVAYPVGGTIAVYVGALSADQLGTYLPLVGLVLVALAGWAGALWIAGPRRRRPAATA